MSARACGCLCVSVCVSVCVCVYMHGSIIPASKFVVLMCGLHKKKPEAFDDALPPKKDLYTHVKSPKYAHKET